jgi:hypothetical protein
VKVLVTPLSMLPVLKELLSAVTVWVVVSLFFTVIVLPAFAVRVAGWKAKFLMVIVVADAAPVLAVLLELVVLLVVLVVLLVVLFELLLPPPQAPSPEASPMTAAPIAAMLVRRRTVRSFRPPGRYDLRCPF